MADKPQSFREAIVWQKAHAFPLAVYRASEPFPKHELFALTSQLRRSAVAPDSADECLYHLILAHDLKCAETTALQTDLEEVSRLLQGYINGLGRNDS